VLDAADLGELERRLPDRDGTVARLGFEPVHEVEHVALDPAQSKQWKTCLIRFTEEQPGSWSSWNGQQFSADRRSRPA
jgi:hypothetical protein